MRNDNENIVSFVHRLDPANACASNVDVLVIHGADKPFSWCVALPIMTTVRGEEYETVATNTCKGIQVAGIMAGRVQEIQ